MQRHQFPSTVNLVPPTLGFEAKESSSHCIMVSAPTRQSHTVQPVSPITDCLPMFPIKKSPSGSNSSGAGYKAGPAALCSGEHSDSPFASVDGGFPVLRSPAASLKGSFAGTSTVGATTLEIGMAVPFLESGRSTPSDSPFSPYDTLLSADDFEMDAQSPLSCMNRPAMVGGAMMSAFGNYSSGSLSEFPSNMLSRQQSNRALFSKTNSNVHNIKGFISSMYASNGAQTVAMNSVASVFSANAGSAAPEETTIFVGSGKPSDEGVIAGRAVVVTPPCAVSAPRMSLSLSIVDDDDMIDAIVDAVASDTIIAESCDETATHCISNNDAIIGYNSTNDRHPPLVVFTEAYDVVAPIPNGEEEKEPVVPIAGLNISQNDHSPVDIIEAMPTLLITPPVTSDEASPSADWAATALMLAPEAISSPTDVTEVQSGTPKMAQPKILIREAVVADAEGIVSLREIIDMTGAFALLWPLEEMRERIAERFPMLVVATTVDAREGSATLGQEIVIGVGGMDVQGMEEDMHIVSVGSRHVGVPANTDFVFPNTYVMCRGMLIHPSYQGCGIGSKLHKGRLMILAAINPNPPGVLIGGRAATVFDVTMKFITPIIAAERERHTSTPVITKDQMFNFTYHSAHSIVHMVHPDGPAKKGWTLAGIDYEDGGPLWIATKPLLELIADYDVDVAYPEGLEAPALEKKH